MTRDVDSAVRKSDEAQWIVFKISMRDRREEGIVVSSWPHFLRPDLCRLDPRGDRRRVVEGSVNYSFCHESGFIVQPLQCGCLG